jgi:hypothetical protein
VQPDLYHQAVAELMREELGCSRLTVALAPCFGWMGDDGRQRRIIEERNPDWYSRFCDQYPSGRARPRRKRHGDTLIKRRHTLRALGEIAGGQVQTEYARRLWPVVQLRAREIQQEHRRRHVAWYMWLDMQEMVRA